MRSLAEAGRPASAKRAALLRRRERLSFCAGRRSRKSTIRRPQGKARSYFVRRRFLSSGPFNRRDAKSAERETFLSSFSLHCYRPNCSQTARKPNRRPADRKMRDKKINRNPIFCPFIFLSVSPASLRLCRAAPIASRRLSSPPESSSPPAKKRCAASRLPIAPFLAIRICFGFRASDFGFPTPPGAHRVGAAAAFRLGGSTPARWREKKSRRRRWPYSPPAPWPPFGTTNRSKSFDALISASTKR